MQRGTLAWLLKVTTFDSKILMVRNEILTIRIFIISIRILFRNVMGGRGCSRVRAYGCETKKHPAPTAPTTLDLSVVGAVGAG